MKHGFLILFPRNSNKALHSSQEDGGHASATLQDQDTKENIMAVVGGYRNGVGKLDSTEFLRNGEWSPGKLSCKTNKMCLFSFFFCGCALFFSKIETLFLISFPFLLHFRPTDAKKA